MKGFKNTGVFLIVCLSLFLLTEAQSPNKANSEEGSNYGRIMRSRSGSSAGFSRILRRSIPEDEEEQVFNAETEDPETVEEIAKRSPNSFSRILRSSFSRILKRNPSSFSRILRSLGSDSSSFSRILRNPYERNMRAQHFSRILKRAHDFNNVDFNTDDEDAFVRYLRGSSFSRIL